MDAVSFGYVARVLRTLPPRTKVVEIGSHIINGTIRMAFAVTAPEADYIGIDTEPGNGVDVVAGGEEYTPPWPPDTVVCCEVLEHTPAAEAICWNAHRMLAAGGVFIVTAAAPPRKPHRSDATLPRAALMLQGKFDAETVQRAIANVPEDWDTPYDEFYRNVTPDLLYEWLKPFSAISVEYNDRHGTVMALARKADA
jgi:hypothetical protein